ncbi:hypothetical protein WMF45_01110 [Sorangium sp. So ce448]|uniref:hypothetical protein n=1 Tax=Sorangium sp. So ce448 TaxID=3133314 RepID=UPI003F5FD19B
MHNRSDQFTKSLLRDGLSLVSAAETEVEVLAATQKIDVYSVPDPARASERAAMGLLGELSAEPSLFEPFHGTPSLRQVRQCLRKQLTWHHELERRARSAARSVAPDEDTDTPPQPAVAFPALVVIGPGRPETVLDAYRCEPEQAGVYQAVPGLAMRVVVLAELPRTRATLLLRLLGSGRRFREAVADLAALPRDAWEKSVVMPLLLHFGLDQQEPTTDEEDDVSAEIQAWFEEYKQQLRNEGRAEEAARAVLTALRVRGIAVPDILRKRILIEKDPELLERWLERAIVAASIADVLPDLS